MKNDEKLTKEFAKKMLVEKFGEEFYHESGLTCAEREADIFLDHLRDEIELQSSDYEDFDDVAFDEIVKACFDDWTSDFLSVTEYLSDFCPICKEGWDDMNDENGECCEHYTATTIKMYRLKKGWSLRDLAAKLGFKSHSIIAAWENGERQPKLASIKKVAKALEIDYIHLLK